MLRASLGKDCKRIFKKTVISLEGLKFCGSQNSGPHVIDLFSYHRHCLVSTVHKVIMGADVFSNSTMCPCSLNLIKRGDWGPQDQQSHAQGPMLILVPLDSIHGNISERKPETSQALPWTQSSFSSEWHQTLHQLWFFSSPSTSFWQPHGMGTEESDSCVSPVSTPSFKQGQGFRNEFLQTQCWSPSSPESLTSLTGWQHVTTFTAVHIGNRLKLGHKMEKFLPHLVSTQEKAIVKTNTKGHEVYKHVQTQIFLGQVTKELSGGQLRLIKCF